MNESEDKYSSTGYLGSVPVFPISRCLIYLGMSSVISGCRGFVIPQLIAVSTQQIKAFSIISIVCTILGFIVSGAVIMKPQKGLCCLFSLMCFGLSIGQSVLAHQSYDSKALLTYPAGVPFDPTFQHQQWEWMTGFAWGGVAMYFVGLVLSLARCD